MGIKAKILRPLHFLFNSVGVPGASLPHVYLINCRQRGNNLYRLARAANYTMYLSYPATIDLKHCDRDHCAQGLSAIFSGAISCSNPDKRSTFPVFSDE